MQTVEIVVYDHQLPVLHRAINEWTTWIRQEGNYSDNSNVPTLVDEELQDMRETIHQIDDMLNSNGFERYNYLNDVPHYVDDALEWYGDYRTKVSSEKHIVREIRRSIVPE